MAETTPAADANQPVFQLQRMYLKDASLEMPNAPQIFLEMDNPAIDIQLEVQQNALPQGGMHEVVVRATVTGRIKDKVLFLVEGKQAGIFEIRNVPADQMEPVLGIVCPGIVYPYLRANVSDLLSRTGMPPVHLAEINFEAFYQQRLAAQAQQAQPATNGGNGALNA
ncbi:MAG: protein-export chaperone SecB [Betaproteobacteria bacterium]